MSISKKDIRVLHETTLSSPVHKEFPLGTKYVKTLVVVKTSKRSEFNFEVSAQEGDLFALDYEPMSDELKKAVQENGSLPTDWLVCLTPAGERRLIRRCLVGRIGDTEARLHQLKEASEGLIDSLFHKRDNLAETGKQIYELIGTDGVLMKYFADQLIAAMKSSSCNRKRTMAAHALNHYMLQNRDFVGYLETKVEHFVEFVNEINSDQHCAPEIVDYVCRILGDWCTHFASHKTELSQLLNDVTADKHFKKALLQILDLPSFPATVEGRERLREAVQKVARFYLKKEEKADAIVTLLVEKIAAQEGEMTLLWRIYTVAGFMQPCSDRFSEKFRNNPKVKEAYEKFGEQFDKAEWFPQPVKVAVAESPKEPKREHVVAVGKAVPPPVHPEPTRPPIPLHRQPDAPPPPAAANPYPIAKRRTVNEVKHRKKHADVRHHHLSYDSRSILAVMEQYLPKVVNSDLKELSYLSEGGFGVTVLVQAPLGGVPVVAKYMTHGRTMDMDVLKEQVNLMKCHHSHIVTILGRIVTREMKNVGILMEYMEKGSLSDVIHNSTEDYSEVQLLTWMTHVTSALGFLHQRDLVHRDIKPANMLLTLKDGELLLKLGDFGMLKAIHDDKKTAAKSCYGTIGYSAPEMWFLADGGISASVDIFAFGVSIWEMTQKLWPHVPENLTSYDGSGRKETMRPKLDHPMYLWMPDLVTKMWQTEPTRRPTIIQVHTEINRLCRLCLPTSDSSSTKPFY